MRTTYVEDYVTGPGQRLFDVLVNGAPAITGLDVFAATGGQGIPVHRDLPATADADGVVTVTFRGDRGVAVVAAIEVIAVKPETK